MFLKNLNFRDSKIIRNLLSKTKQPILSKNQHYTTNFPCLMKQVKNPKGECFNSLQAVQTFQGWRQKSSKPQVDKFIPKSDVTEFEIMSYKVHYLGIPAVGNRMRLAGLYMQATQGPNTTLEPPKSDILNHAYWVAWKQFGDMPKKEAEKSYIEQVQFYFDQLKTDPDSKINAY